MSEGLPFPVAEYRDRAARVRERMRERGVDVLLVISPPNLCYLTGFESVWYPPRAPVGVVVSAGDERLVFLDYERHETLVRETAHLDDAVFYRYEDASETIAATFRDRGWLDGTVGVERWSQSPGAPLVAALADRLGELGGTVVEGDWIVDRVRLVKSAAEMACVRRAAAIVDAAFADLVEHVRPGQTELQIAARLDSVMADHGGEGAAIRTMVSAGPGVWCRTHAYPSRRPVEVGDVMYVDACGVFQRYHADVCRTFAIGRDHPAARAILDVTAGSVDEVRRAVRPGDPLDVAQRVAEEYVFSRFPREQVWWVGGYALGIALPPNWVGHTYLSNDAFESFTWQPGYVTNYENVLFDRDAGFTASYMETLLMTESGIEPLSTRPRQLTVVGRGWVPAMSARPIPAAISLFSPQPNMAVVASVMPSGMPHTAATWYDWEDGRVLLNMDESRRRLEYMRLDPRVALTALEEGAWHKQVSLMGEVVSLEPDPDLRDIDRLAVRYTGQPFANRLHRRWSAWIRVDRWYGWFGDQSWPDAGA